MLLRVQFRDLHNALIQSARLLVLRNWWKWRSSLQVIRVMRYIFLLIIKIETIELFTMCLTRLCENINFRICYQTVPIVTMNFSFICGMNLFHKNQFIIYKKRRILFASCISIPPNPRIYGWVLTKLIIHLDSHYYWYVTFFRFLKFFRMNHWSRREKPKSIKIVDLPNKN